MDWLQIAQSLGIPVMCLVALAVAVWKGIIWIGKYILQPLATKHMDFVDKVSVSVEQQTNAARSTAESMRDLAMQRGMELQTTGTILDKLDHIANKIEKTLETITDVKGAVVIRTGSVAVVPSGHEDKK
jgi:hypothetical protein